MSELDQLAAVLEGRGSRPVRHDGVLGRGMLNAATSPTALARGRSIESNVTTLYLAQHRLPALQPGERVVVGQVDAADVVAGDRTYVVQDRVPQDDGLMDALPLDQGVVL